MQGNPAKENKGIHRGRYGPAGGFQGCALAGMLAKHIVSLYDMCFADGMSFDAGTWDEKITDSLNYLFLLKAIVKEGQTNQQN